MAALETSELIDSMSTLQSVFENSRPFLTELSADEIISLLQESVSMEEKSWMFQSDIVRIIHDKTRHGDKAVVAVARDLGLSKSHCYNLININKEFFDRDPSLRNLPNITVGHFLSCLPFLATKDPEDLIDVIKQASDETWSPTEVKKFLKGEEITRTVTLQHFKLTEVERFSEDTTWASRTSYGPRASILVAPNGDKFLETKVYS